MWITLEILLIFCVFWTHSFNIRDKRMVIVRSFVSHSHARVSSAVVFLCHHKGKPDLWRLGTCQLENRSIKVLPIKSIRVRKLP
jgi:hypothetical protein